MKTFQTTYSIPLPFLTASIYIQLYTKAFDHMATYTPQAAQLYTNDPVTSRTVISSGLA